MRWGSEDWGRLGAELRKSRERQGLSRKKLSELSGVSEKSIQLNEEGRVPMRWPKVLHTLEDVLGWVPGSVMDVLDGGEPIYVPPGDTPARAGGERAPGKPPETSAGGGAARSQGFASARDVELTQSGYLAQDTFIRQMKRHRKLQNVSVEALAKRIAELGGGVELDDLKRLENGTRLLKIAEAGAIARALETSVQWLLASGFHEGMPDEMTAPPSDEELQVEAKAVERRLGEIGEQVNAAGAQAAYAQMRVEEAQQEATMAMMMLQTTTAQQAELAKQYHYLLGRIDSLRAAKGEEQIIQTYPVYEDGE